MLWITCRQSFWHFKQGIKNSWFLRTWSIIQAQTNEFNLLWTWGRNSTHLWNYGVFLELKRNIISKEVESMLMERKFPAVVCIEVVFEKEESQWFCVEYHRVNELWRLGAHSKLRAGKLLGVNFSISVSDWILCQIDFIRVLQVCVTSPNSEPKSPLYGLWLMMLLSHTEYGPGLFQI